MAARVENLHWIPPPAPPLVTLVREAASSQHSRGAGVQDSLHLTLQEAGLAREATATTQQASSNLWSHLRQESASVEGYLTHTLFVPSSAENLPEVPPCSASSTFTPQHSSQPFTLRGIWPLHMTPIFLFPAGPTSHLQTPSYRTRHTNLPSKSNPSYIKGPPFPTLTLSNFLQVTETQTPETPTIPLSVPFIPKSICFNSKSSLSLCKVHPHHTLPVPWHGATSSPLWHSNSL